MKLIILFLAGALLIIMPSGFLFGANPTGEEKNDHGKRLQISAGYYNYGSIDEIYSYNMFSGNSVCYGLKYYYGKGRAREFTSLRYAMMNRAPSATMVNNKLFAENSRERILNSLLFEGIYSYQYPINLFAGNTFRFYVTGDWITTVNITTNYSGVPELVRSGLSPGAMVEASVRRHSISGRFSVPVISWTIRNNYSQSMAQTYEDLNKFAFIRQNSQVQLPNTLMAIDTEIVYNYEFSKHFIVGCEYDFRYMYNSSPRRLESATGIYSAGITYKF